MHRDGPSCTEYHRVVFISSILTSELHRVPPSCFLLLYLVFICTVMNRNAPRCTMMHQAPSSWLFFFYINFWIAPSCTQLFFIALYTSYLHRDAPSTTKLHWAIFAPWCTEMHCDAPSTTKLLYTVLLFSQGYCCNEVLILDVTRCITHGVSWCITVHFSRYPM